MKVIQVVFIVFIALINGIGQDYFSDIIPADQESIATFSLDQTEDFFVIPYMYYSPIDELIHTSLLKTNTDTHIEVHLDSFRMTARPILQTENNLFVLGSNSSYPKNMTIIKYDKKAINKEWRMEHLMDTLFGGNLLSLELNNELYSLNLNRDYQEELDELEIFKFDTDGEKIWSRKYAVGSKDSYGWDFISDSNDDLIVSQTYRDDMSPFNTSEARIFKINSDGVLLNQRRLPSYPVSPAHPIWVANLSDNNLLVSFRTKDNDLWQDFLNTKPELLTWLNSDMEVIKEKYILVSALQNIEHRGIKAGKGDYFFVYGRHTDNESENVESGIITKYANNGDTIWTHKYQHLDFALPNHDHVITDLIEQDNGDIVAYGTVKEPEGFNLPWLLRVSSAGCFDDNQCSEEILISRVDDLLEEEVKIKIFPNPVSDKVIITFPLNSSIEKLNIYGINGKLYSVHSISNNEEIFDIDFNQLSSGVYFVKASSLGGDIFFSEKIIKN